MSCKANRLLPIGQTLLSYGQRRDGAIAAQQMHAPAPIKNQTPSERLARSAVTNLGADEAKKPHAGIAKGLFELFQNEKKIRKNLSEGSSSVRPQILFAGSENFRIFEEIFQRDSTRANQKQACLGIFLFESCQAGYFVGATAFHLDPEELMAIG